MSSSGWPLVALGSLARVKRGASPRPIQDPKWFSDEGYGWVRISDVTASDRVLHQTTQSLSDAGRAASVEIIPGDLIMSICATIGRPLFSGIHACIHDGFVAFKDIDRSRLDPDYLYFFLQGQTRHFEAQSQPGTQRNLNSALVGATEMPLPPLDEQRRIAEVLRSVDEAIAASRATHQQSEVALSALSDDLFSQTLSDDGIGWPKQPLEEMLDNIIDYRGVPPPKADSGIPLLTAKNVRFGYLDFEPREYIATKDYDNWMRRGLPTGGDIMFTTEAPLGNVAEFPDVKAALGQRTLTLVPKAGTLDAKFLKWLLLSKPAQELIWSHATGSTAKGIKQRTFRKLLFGFPDLHEQVRIAELLEDVGAARDAAKRSSETYAAIKAHLILDLLSGRVRVPA